MCVCVCVCVIVMLDVVVLWIVFQTQFGLYYALVATSTAVEGWGSPTQSIQWGAAGHENTLAPRVFSIATCRQILDVDLLQTVHALARKTRYRKCTRVSTGILLAQATVGP